MTLKTAGLMALMAKAGMFLPVSKEQVGLSWEVQACVGAHRLASSEGLGHLAMQQHAFEVA